jgi:putative FmdB family regulatory protein
MPMYEFKCQDCKKSFEELIFTVSDERDVTCPSCHSGKVAKQLSAFAVGGSDSGYGGADFGGGGCATGSCCSGGNCGF